MMQALEISEPEINFECENEVSVGYVTGTCNYLWNRESHPAICRNPLRNQRKPVTLPGQSDISNRHAKGFYWKQVSIL